MALNLKLIETRWKNILPKDIPSIAVLITVVEIAVEQIGP